MRILYLGPNSPLIGYLESQGNQINQFQDKITNEVVSKIKPDFLISYNYRFILKGDVLELFWSNRAINLHISYLPWNRGADPNFWSFAENTPKGVTIHYVDEGIDTGDIIVQKEVILGNEETLKSAYEKLHVEIQILFTNNWSRISNRTCYRQKQTNTGSTHHVKDRGRFMHLLKKGWDTPVREIWGCLQS